MKWIGITGGIASGKSLVSKVLRTLGYEVLDADEISRRVTTPPPQGTGTALPEIYRTFGEDLRHPDGSLDRKALGDLVFSQEELRLKLESIVHPLIRSEVKSCRQALAAQGKNAVFYDVPLLYEKQLENEFDAVVVVTTTPELQLKRLMARNSLSPEEAQLRIRAQIPLSVKEAKSPYVIHNIADEDFLKREVGRVLQALGVAP